MSLLSSIFGNASDVEPTEVAEEFDHVLLPDETVEVAFRVVRDLYVFTTWRMLLVDKQGLTGRKVHLLTVPYRSMTAFSIETAGRFDMDSELTVWISGHGDPLRRTLKKGANIEGVQKAISAGMAGRNA
ncbi:MAG: PH domain-containing protein [Pseudomonadota bacterium]